MQNHNIVISDGIHALTSYPTLTRSEVAFFLLLAALLDGVQVELSEVEFLVLPRQSVMRLF